MLLCDCYFIHTMLSLGGGCIKDLVQKEWEEEFSFILSPGTSTWITEGGNLPEQGVDLSPVGQFWGALSKFLY